ncbi:septation protein A [Thalassotalea sediminis]|uniref:septation protein A n=1 Tax=Thalassotalea sediminis TaxID=1759089 RepID=UPI002573B7B1|nr:septation protein A [Thalassotalea sediminis]
MHAFLEYLPLIVFFIAWKVAGIYWATGALIVASAIHLLSFVVRKKPIPKRQWIFFALIAVFGGLTIFFQNDEFLKWKVTIINGLFAIVLFVSDKFFNKNIIKQLMGESLELPNNIWQKLNLSWVGFFALCAVLNIYIAYNYSQEFWVNFKVFGLMGMTFIFAIATVFAIYKYLPQEESETPEDPK